MDINLIIVVYVGLLLVLLASGLWVGLALMLVGIVTIHLWMPPGSERIIGYTVWTSSNSFVLTCIPLFIFMGEILFRTGLSDRIYEHLTPLMSYVPGQLFHSNIVSCAVFAAACGSSPATAATIGTVGLPELEKRGYNSRLALGSIAAGGSLGILIPPSVIMIIYAAIVGESVARLFLAGIIPGIMISALFMIYIAIRCKLDPGLAPIVPRPPFAKALLSLLGIWPVMLLIGLVLGGIYGGLFTPTEAAGIGAVGALLLAFARRKLGWNAFAAAVTSTMHTTAMLIILLVGSGILVIALTNLGVPAYLMGEVTASAVSPLAVLLLVYLIYLILGMLMDGVSMIVITLPIVYPIIKAVGYDSVWFGIALVLLVEIGLLTPPVGINLFVLHGLRPQLPIQEVIIGSAPFFLILAFGLAILTVFPQIVLWLPSFL
jgi:C4-dicarboxylate transporter, DctM subunit